MGNILRTQLEGVVSQCGTVAQTILHARQDIEVFDKNEQLGAHFATRADIESQRVGLELLHEHFPTEKIIAEEDDLDDDWVPPNCIVFDPLDGTTNFFNRIRDWGVTVCMMRRGQPYAAATYFSDGMIISAIRGEGCHIASIPYREPIKNISWHGKLDKTEFGTDVGSWAHKSGTFDTVLRPLSQNYNVLSSMAAVEAGRRILMGQLGAYYNIGIAKIWDAAAMALCVEEAKGIVCAPDGGPVKWNTIRCDWVVAGNQKLADVVLEYTKAL